MAKYTLTGIDDFVSAHKRQATHKIAKEILESLYAYGFNTDDLLYAIADIFIERGELNVAAVYLQKACEHLPVGIEPRYGYRWRIPQTAKLNRLVQK